MAINEKYTNSEFKENCVDDEEKNSNEFETECNIIFGLKPSCYRSGKCDIELKIITVGRIGSESSPFGQWFYVPCLSAINKKWIGPRERKLIDYCVSLEKTQQR